MALTVVDNGSLTPVTGENFIVQFAAGAAPSVFVAVFDFHTLVGCTVAVACAQLVPGAGFVSQVYRSADLPVSSGVSDGFITPPIPVNTTGDLYVHLLSGTASTLLYWMAYELT